MARAIKTKDFDIRAGLVTALINAGYTRLDIRHEITLDTSSSGGRSDLLLLCGKAGLVGFEIKSGADVLDRMDAQIKAMKSAMDYGICVACPARKDIHNSGLYCCAPDGTISEAPRRYYYYGAYGSTHLCERDGEKPDKVTDIPGDVLPDARAMWRWGASRCLSVTRMMSLLWADECRSVAALLGFNGMKKTRCGLITIIGENYSLAQVRPLVMNQLRQRQHSEWEKSFWKKYDAMAVQQ